MGCIPHLPTCVTVGRGCDILLLAIEGKALLRSITIVQIVSDICSRTHEGAKMCATNRFTISAHRPRAGIGCDVAHVGYSALPTLLAKNDA
jgi:hypothetical protein